MSIQINHIKIYKDECDAYDEYCNMSHAVEEEDEDGNEYVIFYTINQYDIEEITNG